MTEMTPETTANSTVDSSESDEAAASPDDSPRFRPPATEADPAAGDDGEWDDEDSILTWKLLVAVAVVLGVIFVGAFVLFNNKKKDTTATATEGPATTQVAALPTIRDAFDRPDLDSLGKTSTGEDWQVVTQSGKWGIKGKQALVVDKNKGPRNVAVLDTGSADGSVSAEAAKLTDGWGLVFRYRGPNAYWYVQWNDQFKAFHVFKVQDGNGTEVVKGGVPVPNSKDGMAVKVEYSGPTITLFVDGKPLETIANDPYLKDQTKVGLYVSDKGADTARWSDFAATKGLNGPPLTAAPDPKAKASTPSSQAKAAPKAPGGTGQAGQTTSTTGGSAAPPKK